MGRTASLLGGLVCLGLAGAGGYASLRKPPVQPPKPQPTGLVIEPASRDFGNVSSTDVLWAEASVVNPFHLPVSITDVSKSCSCAESDVGKRELAPGETTTLRVGWRMAGKHGRVRETVLVRYGVGGQTSAGSFHLYAVVTPAASYSPQSLRFGAGSDPVEQVVTFVAERPGAAVAVQEVISSTPVIKATVDPDGRTVRARFDPAATVVQGIRHTLMVKVTGFDTPWVQIPLELSAPNPVNGAMP